MAPNIVVVGSSNTDMIIKLDRIPQPGETRLGGEFHTAAGGKGANQAVAAARAGGAVTLVARVGKDMFGERAVAGLIENRINVDHVLYDDSPSGVALIFVGEDGENSIGVGSGANANLSPADVRQANAAFAIANIVVVQLESPLDAVQEAADMAAVYGVPLILNPAPAQPLRGELLAKVAVLTPNESEAEILTGVKVDSDASCAQAANILLRSGVTTVIITLGSRGAYVASSAGQFLVPGFAVKSLDTTAAGDAFNGALAVALAQEMPIADAVRFANAAGAIAVTRMGAQPSAPTRGEILALADGGLMPDELPAAPVNGDRRHDQKEPQPGDLRRHTPDSILPAQR